MYISVRWRFYKYLTIPSFKSLAKSDPANTGLANNGLGPHEEKQGVVGYLPRLLGEHHVI